MSPIKAQFKRIFPTQNTVIAPGKILKEEIRKEKKLLVRSVSFG